MPTIIGSTTVSAKREAIVASTALPPDDKICAPAAEAKGWLVTTTERPEVTGDFSHLKLGPEKKFLVILNVSCFDNR